MPEVRILSADDLGGVLPMPAAIEAMRTAFGALAAGAAQVPQRIHLDTGPPPGTSLFMPAAMQGAIGVKTVTLFPGNPGQGLPYIQGTYCLFDGDNGTPTAFMNAAGLTAIRTGAASGLATELLAREDATAAAILGAGVQGRTQLAAVCAVRRIERVRVFDAVPAAAERFAAEMAPLLGVEVTVADSPAAAIRDADVVCAATVSETPVFDDADLPAGVHLNAIGSYKPQVQEIPAATVMRSRLVVDEREAALDETGDLIIPIGQGLITAEHIAAELGELVNGAKPGRTCAEQVTFFKSVGLAIQDLAAARVAVRNAEAQGVGVVVPI